ncbi:MAG: PLP-dependent aminotransferase family protein [Pyrinomonadaceae bacterium]
MDRKSKKRNIPFPFISISDRAASNIPIYRQIYESVRRAILSGAMQGGSRIPSSRSLSAELGVSRMTVINAYDQLFAEGYLEGKIGSGTFVAGELPEELLTTPKVREIKTVARPRELNLSRLGEQLERDGQQLLREPLSTRFQPFQNGLTAVDSFPFDTWGRIAARLSRSGPHAVIRGNDLAGFRPLREAIAAHLRSARAVRCEPEQVIVTAGAQQGLALVSAVLLEPRDNVWIEDPGYNSARDLFSLSGAQLVPVPVDGDGIDLEAAAHSGKKPKLIYVTPSHQYPLGMTMSLGRRLSLIETARAARAWVVEDDYDSEFRYSGRPIASLQGLDIEGRVIYVGTFSKTIFPSLKLGCLVVPPDLVDVFTAARTVTGAQSPMIDQAVLAEFISEGHFARHIRRMRTLYQERQKFLVEQVHRHLAGFLEMTPGDAGMHLVGWLPEGFNDREVAMRADELDIRLSAISDHSIMSYPRMGLIFGYAAFNEKQTRRGVAKIAVLLTELSKSKCFKP